MKNKEPKIAFYWISECSMPLKTKHETTLTEFLEIKDKNEIQLGKSYAPDFDDFTTSPAHLIKDEIMYKVLFDNDIIIELNTKTEFKSYLITNEKGAFNKISKSIK